MLTAKPNDTAVLDDNCISCMVRDHIETKMFTTPFSTDFPFLQCRIKTCYYKEISCYCMRLDDNDDFF